MISKPNNPYDSNGQMMVKYDKFKETQHEIIEERQKHIESEK